MVSVQYEWKKGLILILGHYSAFEFLEEMWQLNATMQCTFANMQNGVYVLCTIQWNGILKVNKKLEIPRFTRYIKHFKRPAAFTAVAAS